MTKGLLVKEKLEKALKDNIREIKQIETEKFPINFPAMIIDYPTEESQYIGIRLVNNKFTFTSQLIMPLGINIKSDMEKLNNIIEKIKTLIRTKPYLDDYFTYVEISNFQPKNFSIETNKEQSVEFIGYNITFEVNIIENI